ncbi:MAG: RelA/SpoT family protein [Candidatus Berkelbacteria bacterium]|nr:RelA/SpoT family protein [Candidatus Berkelbacteria bacterium]
MIQKLFQAIKYLGNSQQNKIKKAIKTLLNLRVSTTHSVNIAIKLANLNLDEATIIAGLLHDAYQNKKLSQDEIETTFGLDVVLLLESLKKINVVKFKTAHETKTEHEKQAETLIKMFIALAEDIRVIFIILADRWETLENMSSYPRNIQKEIALETLEIYAPLANRLGMCEIKGTLEDLAFFYVYPVEFNKLKRLALPEYKIHQDYINHVKKILTTELHKTKIKAKIGGRAKHFYSLYKKLKKYEGDFSKIYDLVALRIIVPTISDCYAVLGLIHKKWRPLQGRIKDYIAMPKPNGYQSLHTTVFCEKGKIVEFQIRTEKMHDLAEYGVAAHWHYTEKTEPKEFKQGAIRTEIDTKVPDRMKWVEELPIWKKELSNSREFLKTMKLDVFSDRIFTFTPKGDVIDLPEGATPIDFAYHIHSDIGDHMSGAKVNGKMIPLSHQLENNDIVEILTAKNAKPSRDWERIAKTAKAREKIRSHFKNNI